MLIFIFVMVFTLLFVDGFLFGDPLGLGEEDAHDMGIEQADIDGTFTVMHPRGCQALANQQVDYIMMAVLDDDMRLCLTQYLRSKASSSARGVLDALPGTYPLSPLSVRMKFKLIITTHVLYLAHLPIIVLKSLNHLKSCHPEFALIKIAAALSYTCP